jgi:hypothetical protein
MVARPASSDCSAQAIRVKGATLFSRAWTKNRRQIPKSRGNAIPRAYIHARRSEPAMRVLAAMNVSGGIVSTPTLMKV